MTKRGYLVLGIVFSLVLTIGAYGQDFRATLTGRVIDASNAAIPGAEVEVKNVGTNEVRTALTDEQGNYRIPLLQPGKYTIGVEFPGFKKYVREGIELNIAQTATVDIVLEIGEVTDEVTIVASTPLLETSNADRGGVIDRLRVHEFPLNARNPFMLGILVAGVNFHGAAIWQRPFDNGAIADWTVNGSKQRDTEFLLDGAPNNGQAGGNNIAYVPPVDSVDEFKIMTNTYDSQYGKTGGGIVNVSLKSGTNDFHGTVYEFARRNALDANDFRNKARGREKEGHYLDQYGFQVQGPVILPKLYHGRDKTFFMFNYEGYREGVPSPLTLSVPEPEMLDGDFSRLVDAQGRKITIYDPATGKADASAPGGWSRQPFSGNIIPANRIHPVAKKILSFQPKPNTKSPGQGYAQGNLFLSPSLALDDFYSFVAKVDHNINSNHRMFVRFARNDRTEDRNTNGVLEGPGQDGQQPFKRVNDNFVWDHVSSFSPTFILNLRASFLRFEEFGFGRGNVGFDKTTLGFPESLVRQLPNGVWFGRYEFQDYNNLGRHQSRNLTDTVAFHPNITKIKGAHSLKAGVDMRWVQFIQQNTGNPFRLRATRGFTQRQFNQGDPLSGNAIASFLLGIPGEGNIDFNLFPTNLFKYYAPWFQDDWKVTPKLTLNLGVRWDINVSPNERFNRLNRGFDATAVNPADKLIDRTKFPDVPALRGGIRFAGVDGNPRIASDIDWNNIQPRVGFAYRLTDKLVTRGGWGIYYLNPNNGYLQFNGFSQTTPFLASLDGGRTPRSTNTLGNPFPEGVQAPPGNSLGLLTFLGRDDFNFDGHDFVVPYVHQFSLGFQYQLPWESRIELAYVGNRTINLQTDRPFNEPSLETRRKCNPLEGGNPLFCDGRVANPFRGLEPFFGTTHFSAATLSRWDLARPLPHFGRITELTRNDGRIWYNSLQATWDKRAKEGLHVISTYTFSKQMIREGWLDVAKNIPQQSVYFQDRPHRFTWGSVWQLPFGPGRRFLSSGILSHILGGWENTVILQWQSGRPWQLPANLIIVKDPKTDNIDWKAPKVWGVQTSTKGNTQAACVARVNDDGSISLMPYSVAAGCTDYHFLRIPRYAPGSVASGRGAPFNFAGIRRHTIPIADVSLNKMIYIRESMKLQIRFEAFNFTNTFHYYGRNWQNNPDNANFGSMFPHEAGNTESSYPRHVQIAVKFMW